MVKTKCEGIFVIYPLRANQPLKRMNNTTKLSAKQQTFSQRQQPNTTQPHTTHFLAPDKLQTHLPLSLLQTHAFRATKRPISSREMSQIIP